MRGKKKSPTPSIVDEKAASTALRQCYSQAPSAVLLLLLISGRLVQKREASRSEEEDYNSCSALKARKVSGIERVVPCRKKERKKERREGYNRRATEALLPLSPDFAALASWPRINDATNSIPSTWTRKK